MLTVVSGASCLLVLIASALTRHHGKHVMLPCAIAFCLGWALFESSWLPAPYAPFCVIKALTGASIYAPQMWAATDCVLAVYILTKGGEYMFGLCLFALFVAQGCMHVLYQVGAVNYEIYINGLNGTFACEVAVFLTAGASGISQHVADSWRVCFGSHKRSALVEARERRNFQNQDPADGIHSALERLYRID